MQLISPSESLYVISPFTSQGPELIKLCLQYLCYRRVLQVEERWLLLHPNDRYERLKLFFYRGEHFNDYQPSSAESFLLEPFKEHPILEFYQLRNYLMDALNKKVDRFKADYICEDVHKSGHCQFYYFLTSKGRGYSRYLNSALDEIELNIDSLIATDVDKLVKKLEALQGNILLLQPEIMKKLEEIDYEVLYIPNISFLSSLTSAFKSSSYSSVGAFTLSGSGGSFGSASSFGGFGGGSFGGGGAGGSW